MAKFRSEKLTTCRVTADGGGVGSLRAAGRVSRPPEPRCDGLRQRIQDARCIFGLGECATERAKGQACLIAMLKTPDGFEVCFGIPFEACRSLGRNPLRAAQTHDPERTSHVPFGYRRFGPTGMSSPNGIG
jgi:hypothetical protein